jgi:hypothetical protein
MTPKPRWPCSKLAVNLALLAVLSPLAPASAADPRHPNPKSLVAGAAIASIEQIRARLAELVEARHAPSFARVSEVTLTKAAEKARRQVERDQREAEERLRHATEHLERARRWQFTYPKSSLHQVELALRDLDKLGSQLALEPLTAAAAKR